MNQRFMGAGNKGVGSSNQRAKQRHSQHAGALPGRVEYARGNTGARLFHASQQRGCGRRNQQAETTANDHQLRHGFPVAGARFDSEQHETPFQPETSASVEVSLQELPLATTKAKRRAELAARRFVSI
jgi:hypothetical protein